MFILRQLLFHAARRLAADPRARAKAAEVYQKEVKPRAEAAWRQAKPRLDAARSELKDIAHETDPRRHPRKFAAKLKDRLFGGKKEDR